MRDISLDQRRLVLMFTDMVGCGSLKTKLGDRAYIEKVLGPHDAIFRQVLADIPGAQEIKNTGDGFLATFPLVSDAVNAALRFQHEVWNYPWEKDAPRTRIGIHVGEGVIVKGAEPARIDIQGLAVDMCSRVMSVGLGGQILLTRHAYDDGRQFVREHPQVLESGGPMELRWLFHGRYRFKGKEADPLEVFEVGASDSAPFTKPPNSEKARRVVDAEDKWRAVVRLVAWNKPETAGRISGPSSTSGWKWLLGSLIALALLAPGGFIAQQQYDIVRYGPRPPRPHALQPPENWLELSVPRETTVLSATVADSWPFFITLDDDILADAPDGQTVSFTVRDGLKTGDTVVMANGAKVTGAIVREVGKKMFRIWAKKIGFRLMQAITVDGQKLNIRATPGHAGGGPASRPFDTGKGSKSKGLAAAKGTEYIVYTDGEQIIPGRK